MPVVGKRVKRKDVEFIRGDTFRFGFTWRRLNLATGEISVVDAAEYTGDQDTPGGPRYSAVLELRSADDTQVWLTQSCDQLTTDGIVSTLLAAFTFTGASWQSRRSGRYKFTVTDAVDENRDTVCWGYFVLVN